MVDHRASPGIPADKAIQFGYDPSQVAEGKLFEAATLTCSHCSTVVIRNPGRIRPRGHCFHCNQYICDWCDAARHKSDYVHHTFADIVELQLSGKNKEKI